MISRRRNSQLYLTWRVKALLIGSVGGPQSTGEEIGEEKQLRQRPIAICRRGSHDSMN